MRALLFLLHAAFTTLKAASDTIVSALWHFKGLWRNYGEIVVWCCRTRKFLVFHHAKLREIA